MRSHEKTAPLRLTALRPLGLGLCVGVVCCTLLLLLAAVLLNTADIPHAAVTPLAVVAAGAGAFAAGLTTGLAVDRRRLLWGTVGGALLYLVLLVVGLIRSGGVDGGYALIKWAVLTLCGAIGGLVAASRR